jgi:hypothetical protein
MSCLSSRTVVSTLSIPACKKVQSLKPEELINGKDKGRMRVSETILCKFSLWHVFALAVAVYVILGSRLHFRLLKQPDDQAAEFGALHEKKLLNVLILYPDDWCPP